MRLLTVFLMLTLIVAIAPQLNADNFELLGKRTVSFRTDRDQIPVANARGHFSKIKLSVHRNGIQIINVKVHFGNGQVYDVPIRQFIPQNGYTRNIDLPGNMRNINRVSFVYKSSGRRWGRALVKLWGIRISAQPPTIPPQPPTIPPQPPTIPQHPPVTKKWVFLGQRWVNFQVDRDVITVTGLRGVYSKIKLSVHNNNIEILDLKVHFAGGLKYDIAVRQFIQANSYTRNIDLPGYQQVINRVALVYRTRGPKWGKALVKLWGVRLTGQSYQPPATPQQPPHVTPQPPNVPPQVQSRWVLLGQRWAKFHLDRDVIHVTGVRGKFTKIKLSVHQNSLQILDLKIKFGNGAKYDIAVREFIQQGGYTRTIDLPGGLRTINKLVFTYRTSGPRRGKAQVKLWGRR